MKDKEFIASEIRVPPGRSQILLWLSMQRVKPPSLLVFAYISGPVNPNVPGAIIRRNMVSISEIFTKMLHVQQCILSRITIMSTLVR